MTDQTNVDQKPVTKEQEPDNRLAQALKEIETLKLDNTRLQGIKEKMVSEQQTKNEKHKILMSDSDSLKESFLTLKSEHEELTSRFESRDSFFIAENARKAASLESKLSQIPEDRKNLIPDYSGFEEGARVQNTLDYIERNQLHLFGKADLKQTAFPFHKPAVKTENEIKLTPEEAVIAERGNISLPAALEMKRRDNEYFQKFLTK